MEKKRRKKLTRDAPIKGKVRKHTARIYAAKKKSITEKTRRKLMKSSPFSRYFDLMERSKAIQIDFPEDKNFIDDIIEAYKKQNLQQDISLEALKRTEAIPEKEPSFDMIMPDAVANDEERVVFSFETKDYDDLNLIEKEMYALNEYLKMLAPEVEGLLVKIDYDNFLGGLLENPSAKVPQKVDAATYVAMQPTTVKKREKMPKPKGVKPMIYTITLNESQDENEDKEESQKIIVNIVKKEKPPKMEVAASVKKPFWPKNISMTVKERNGRVSLAIQTLKREDRHRKLMANYCAISGRRIHKIRNIKLRHNRVTSSEESDSISRLTNKRVQTPKSIKTAVMKVKQKKKKFKLAEKRRKTRIAKQLEASEDEENASDYGQPQEIFSKTGKKTDVRKYPILDDNDPSAIQNYLTKVIGHDDPWDRIMVSKSVLPKVTKLIRGKVEEQLELGVEPKTVFRRLFGTDYCEINPNLKPIFTNDLYPRISKDKQQPDFLNNITKIAQLFIKNLIRKHSPDPDNSVEAEKNLVIGRILVLAERFAKPASEECLAGNVEMNPNEETPGYSIDELMKVQGDMSTDQGASCTTLSTGEMVDETVDTIIDKYEMQLDPYATSSFRKFSARVLNVRRSQKSVKHKKFKPHDIKRCRKIIGSIPPPATPDLELKPIKTKKLANKAKFNYRKPSDRRTEEFRKKFIRYTNLLSAREERLRRVGGRKSEYRTGKSNKVKQLKKAQVQIKLKNKVGGAKKPEISKADFRVDATVNTSNPRIVAIRTYGVKRSQSMMDAVPIQKRSASLQSNLKAESSIEKYRKGRRVLKRIDEKPEKVTAKQKRIAQKGSRTKSEKMMSKNATKTPMPKKAGSKVTPKKPNEKAMPKKTGNKVTPKKPNEESTLKKPGKKAVLKMGADKVTAKNLSGKAIITKDKKPLVQKLKKFDTIKQKLPKKVPLNQTKPTSITTKTPIKVPQTELPTEKQEKNEDITKKTEKIQKLVEKKSKSVQAYVYWQPQKFGTVPAIGADMSKSQSKLNDQKSAANVSPTYVPTINIYANAKISEVSNDLRPVTPKVKANERHVKWTIPIIASKESRNKNFAIHSESIVSKKVINQADIITKNKVPEKSIIAKPKELRPKRKSPLKVNRIRVDAATNTDADGLLKLIKRRESRTKSVTRPKSREITKSPDKLVKTLPLRKRSKNEELVDKNASTPKLSILSGMHLPRTKLTTDQSQKTLQPPPVVQPRSVNDLRNLNVTNDFYSRNTQQKYNLAPLASDSTRNKPISQTNIPLHFEENDNMNDVDIVDSLMLIRKKLQKRTNYQPIGSLSADSVHSYANKDKDDVMYNEVVKEKSENNLKRSSGRRRKKILKDQGTEPIEDSQTEAISITRHGLQNKSQTQISAKEIANKFDTGEKLKINDSTALIGLQSTPVSTLVRKRADDKITRTYNLHENYETVSTRVQEKLMEYMKLEQSIDYTRYIWNYHQEREKVKNIKRMTEIRDEIEELLRKTGFVTVTRNVYPETQLNIPVDETGQPMNITEFDEENEDDIDLEHEDAIPGEGHSELAVAELRKKVVKRKTTKDRRTTFRRFNIKRMFKRRKQRDEGYEKQRKENETQQGYAKRQNKPEDTKKLVDLHEKLKRIHTAMPPKPTSWRP